MTKTNESVKVTQADRDAAASAVVEAHGRSFEIRTGDADELAVVQAFARHRYQPQEREAVLAKGNERGLYDTSKVGPELVAFLEDRSRMLAALRDEMSAGYRGWLDDAVGALQIATEHFATLCTSTSISEREAVLEQVRLAYKTGYSEAYEDCTGTADNDASEEGWGQYLEANPALTTPAPAVSTDEIVDSGMSAEAVERAEWAWANLPTGPRKWTSLTTAEKALVCHVLSRIQGEANTN